ncbi:MAG: hypothetical protein COB12_08990 [Flavobacterium sp.]|nr:MAG: hypothetical protein COB12_08990 [Flavobacterium sp.]
MAKKFSKTESEITKLFKVGKTFTYNDLKYTILNSGKPNPSKGECKTDTYVSTIDQNEIKTEFKISIKQTNADFLENKMNIERAIQIFGKNASEIIKKSTENIEQSFKDDFLVLFKKHKRTESKTIKIGWKFELLNKKSGEKSAEIKLTKNQIVDIYAGTNLDENKKNSMINDVKINNSGIANFILFVEDYNNQTLQEIVDLIIPIKDYCKDKKIYFACKAINYRLEKDKWDGNRPLSVFIEWSEIGDNITSKIVFNKPLETKANEIGNNIRDILKRKNIKSDNFNSLEIFLKNTKYLKD